MSVQNGSSQDMSLNKSSLNESSPEPSWQYIDTDTQLVEVQHACKDTDVITVDTEFVRDTTYYPNIGLVQIYNGQDCFLIDVPTINDPTPLVELLTDTDLLKVLHACSEDMEVLQFCFGVIPAPLFDTQIAAAMLGIGFSVSYQSLVEHHLSVSLQKDQTRSNWLQRPLSPRQLNYAALDVIHLLQVYKKQRTELEARARLQWVEDESRLLGRNMATQIPPEEYYKKIRGLWLLDRRQLNTMKVLCAWREETARAKNIPRNRVVDQKVLIDIIRSNPTSKQALALNMTSRQIRKYGDKILSLLTESQRISLDECPELVAKPNASLDKKLLRRLGQVVQEQARTLCIAPELLTKKRHLEKLLRSADGHGGYQLPAELSGWRETVIGDELLRTLAEDCADG